MAFLGTFAAMGKSTSRSEPRNIPRAGARNTPREKLLALLPKVGRAGARNVPLPETVPVPGGAEVLLRYETPYFSGAFFIFAQVRGNRGGVSLTLRITTSRWVTAVPGMA